MDRRQEIYEKALKLFIENGYDNTPLSQIAKSLNITKAGLYHYFSSKEELLFNVHTHSVQKDFLPILEQAERIKDPEERIRYFIKQYTVNIITKDPSVKIAIHEIKKLKPEYQKEIKNLWRRTFNLVRDTLAELESGKHAKKTNKTFATFALFGMCNWTFYWFDYENRESSEELAETIIDIFFYGVSGPRK